MNLLAPGVSKKYIQWVYAWTISASASAYATIGESMATLQITQHSAWLVLKHEGIGRDDHAIGAIQGPSGVFLPWLFGTNSEPNGRRPRSGGGLRAKCRGIIAGSLGN